MLALKSYPIFLLLMIISTQLATPAVAQTLAHERLPAIARTMNIFHHREPTEAEINAIADAGFSAIRLCLKPFDHMQQDADGEWQMDAEWLDTVDASIEAAQARGMALIVDNHEYNEMNTDPRGKLDKFLASWRILGEHYRSQPNKSVFFELLNEPNGALDAELWNEYLRLAIDVVRDTNPERTLIIGPASWNSFKELKNLSLPEEDRNIIVTFHYYLPFRFTHQGASWVEHMKEVKDVRWLGTPEEVEALKDDFRVVLQWQQKHNRPILLGEFGAISKAALEDRVRYYYAVRALSERCGFAWAVWSFKGQAYGLFDPKEQVWRKVLLAAVMKPLDASEQAK